VISLYEASRAEQRNWSNRKSSYKQIVEREITTDNWVIQYMTERTRIKKFLLYVLPILIWVGVIFGFSSQTHKEQDLRPWIKKEISDKTVKQYFSGKSFNYGTQKISLKTSSASGFVEFFIRKFAHLFIYSILGMLIARLFKALTRWRLGWNYLISVLLCGAYAATDEFHQGFVQGRTARPADVVLDTVGAMLGILLYLSISQIFKQFARKRA
ncbi:MAG: VanZ-like protein, partial [Paenibacillus sp.]|nr:VanZ-like protein [Paenibacillus sp.]